MAYADGDGPRYLLRRVQIDIDGLDSDPFLDGVGNKIGV